MAEQGVELDSEQVQFIETRQMQGTTFTIYGGAGLGQGDTLALRLSNLDDLEFAGMPNAPGATVPAGRPVDQDLLRWITIGLGGLAIVLAAVVYPALRAGMADPDDEPATRQQKLLLLLAKLDEAFAAGELEEAVYEQARRRYKAELAELMVG